MYRRTKYKLALDQNSKEIFVGCAGVLSTSYLTVVLEVISLYIRITLQNRYIERLNSLANLPHYDNMTLLSMPILRSQEHTFQYQ